MKKIVLLLFATIFLSSCNSHMGSAERYWIVYEVQADGIRNNNNAIYTVQSFDGDGYRYNGFRFEDKYGKFQVGDTVKLVKLKH
jgi:hypothetical protein